MHWHFEMCKESQGDEFIGTSPAFLFGVCSVFISNFVEAVYLTNDAFMHHSFGSGKRSMIKNS